MPDDPFGVRMIYPTKSGANNHEWYLNSSGSNLNESSSPRTGSDSQGTYYFYNDDQIRAGAYTVKFGYKPDKINTDAGDIDYNVGGTGQMQEGEDTWRDVEMTGYIFVTSSTCGDDGDFVWYCRGGRHSDDRDACEGQAMKCAWEWCTGRTRFRKEQRHPSDYISGDWRAAYGGNVRNKWIGAKFMCYNVPTGGSGEQTQFNVKMESWIDKDNNNNWVQVNTMVDNGTGGIWGGGGDSCNCCSGVTNQRMTWSGPIAAFRWDVTGIRFKKLSVREISPGGGFTPPPPGQTPPGPGPGPTPVPPGTPPPPPPDSTEIRLVYPSTGITASTTFEGNTPDRVNDGDFTTGWVGAGLPVWINIDMLAIKRVSFVRINWADPVASTYTFSIESSTDNVVYRTMYSHFQTVGPQEELSRMYQYDLEDHNARFVRINVFTNTSGDGAGMGEINIFGNDTPIGGEPPGGGPPGRDPNFFYGSSKHIYHINYEVTDACATEVIEEGSGPEEVEGPPIDE